MADSSPIPTEKAAKAQELARASYLMERTKLLRHEIQQLRNEKRDVVEKQKAVADRASPEARSLRQRRVYLNFRPTEAAAELNAAIAERKQIKAKYAAA